MDVVLIAAMRAIRKLAPVFLMAAATAHAATGIDAWLRYNARPDVPAQLPPAIVNLDASSLATSARDELIRGVRGMYGRTLRIEGSVEKDDAIVLATLDDLAKTAPQWHIHAVIPNDGYWLKTVNAGGHLYLLIAAANDRGLLYGAFEVLRKLQLGVSIAHLDEQQSPYAPIRVVNQWDNLDGSMERGYGGRSIFWDNGHARADLTRAGEYGRLLASIGINGCAINNVNADLRMLTPEFLPEVARIAEALRPWGVRVLISVDFGSPKAVGKLDTFDPADARVAAWWRQKMDELYRAVPDLYGIVIKADSEGRVGPSFYHRTHADAANVVARALQPHGGLLFYRGFVYDHHMDWRNPKNDRARAAFDNFKPLDGAFDDNVVIQIKNGPIDFQVREPVSPLIGALEKTNQAMELQITQEYMGQGRHLVFLVPQWKETLDFDLHARESATPAKALAAGKVFKRPTGGFVGVANVGLDDSWLGNQLSQGNLYGFGRLAWNADLSARVIADEWTRLTFGGDPAVVRIINAMQLSSWRTYENYTGPLGLQTLTDIVGNHYGVAVEASENNSWGQWHRADDKGVGMDRSVATGTGFAGQYRPPVARMFESMATTPDDLLLFFHHVPYQHRLHDGKTVIQYIYDAHYQGAEAVQGYLGDWMSLRGLVDDQRFEQVRRQLQYQAGSAELWRDAVNDWFLRASGTPDSQSRVGHHPGRIEAEAMTLDGYAVQTVQPWEAASGGRAVACKAPGCTASFRFDGAPGFYMLRVRYFDQNNGASLFQIFLGDQKVDEWIADETLPSRKIDASTSVLRTIPGILLRPGDAIRVHAIPEGGEAAALDYLEVIPAPWPQK